MTAESPRSSFRRSVLKGERPTLVVNQKRPRQGRSGEDLGHVPVQRAETRRGNHRQQDRHRLRAETATLRFGDQAYQVDLVNLSTGGAMVRAGFTPRLWDMVELELGHGPGIECAVRWVRDDLIGLEFAHETRIDCTPDDLAALLLQVVQRNFPDLQVKLAPSEQPSSPAEPTANEEDLGKRDEKRHPLIWKGEIHFTNGSNPVRLRNISSRGALVDVATPYAVGSEVLLDLGDAGQYFVIVSWAQGQQAGLRFKEPFDLACLANAKPELTPNHWTRPSYLDPGAEDVSPWDPRWGRSSLEEIRSELEGFLKR